jgi:hypothetical protein
MSRNNNRISDMFLLLRTNVVVRGMTIILSYALKHSLPPTISEPKHCRCISVA